MSTDAGSATDTGFLLAQGMVMQRHGLGADAAVELLHQTATDAGQDLREAARAFHSDHLSRQTGTAQA